MTYSELMKIYRTLTAYKTGHILPDYFEYLDSIKLIEREIKLKEMKF